jgi:N-acetylmuramoyl-L-alanine amidase
LCDAELLAAKLIKNREHTMTTGIKNLKHCTNKSCLVVLLLILLLFSFIHAASQTSGKSDPWVVVIDAGHGGKDPGAVSKATREKDIVLAIALKLGKYVSTLDNVNVLYTRSTDVFIDLDKRPKFANDNNADVFVSIHANWGESSKVKGTETFVMGPSKNDQNLKVAMKENSVITLEKDYTTKYQGFDPNSPESYIIFTVMQKEYSAQSLNLAGMVQDQFRLKAGRTDRSVKQDVFLVLWGTTMPSILVETGFITNPDEVRFLSSPEGHDLIASAIFRALRDYKNTIDKKSGVTTNKEEIPPINQKDTSGMISFMIQITTSSKSKELKPENFKGINELTEINEGNQYKYATGKFKNYEKAVEERKKLSDKYPDAFVVAVKDNKIVPLQEALEKMNQK